MRLRAPVSRLILALLATACADRTLTDPTEVHGPAFTETSSCALDVSDAEALAAIAALLTEINTLEADGALNAGQAAALRNHLENARRHINEGRYCPARAQLEAFREQVGNFVADDVLTEGDATPLVESVDDVLGETSPEIEQASISAGLTHSCGLTATGRAYCWGENLFGELGSDIPGWSSVPVAVSTALRFASISAGYSFTCALTTEGAVYCWGMGRLLGDGSTDNRSTPMPVSSGLTFSSISAGERHSCAITTAGSAYCWGANDSGQIGDGSTELRLTPVPVSTSQTFNQVSAGTEYTCGITSAGAAYCWGRNSFGQLGDGSFDDRLTPTAVSTALNFERISAGRGALPPGAQHTCGVTTGTAYCWGNNTDGQVGDGTTDTRPIPVPVNTSQTFVSISAGAIHSCGLTALGAAYCWGDNSRGQLGDGTTAPRLTPVAVDNALSFQELSAGLVHTCGLTTAGAAFCWGWNFFGQIGDGTGDNRLTPTEVSGWSSLP